MSSKQKICSPEVGGNSCDVPVASVGDSSFKDESLFLQQPILKNQLRKQDAVKHKKTLNNKNYKKITTKNTKNKTEDASKNQVYRIYNYEVTEEEIIQSVETQIGLSQENNCPTKHITGEKPPNKSQEVMEVAKENKAQQTTSNELWDFKGDTLRPRKNNILRLYYNNCNGMEINPLIRTKLRQKKEKKRKSS